MSVILNAIICYKNSEEIIEYINKLTELNNSNVLAVSIVINDDITSANDLEKRLSDLPIKTVVTKAQQNLGYLNGLVEGVKQYLLRYSDSLQWIIMSNTDIAYPDKNFINKLLSKHYSSDVWCIGPSVYVPHKKAFDNPASQKRRSLFGINKLIFVFSIPVIRVLYQWGSVIKTRLVKTKESESGYVYEVHGCYFLVNYELYKKLLQNPYKSFMYSEEAFIAETVFQNKKRVFFDSDLRIEHNEHSVTSSFKLSKIAKLTVSSMKEIKKEFYE